MAESCNRRRGLRAGGRAASAFAAALTALAIGPGAGALAASGGAKAGASTATTSASTTTTSGTQTSTSPSKSSTSGSKSSSKSSKSTGGSGTTPVSTNTSKKTPKLPAITPLTGWLGAGATFPSRAIVLSEAAALTPGAVSLSENGSRIPSFSLTRMTAAGPHDFGLVFVVDQTMDPQTLSSVMAAIRAAAAQRAAGQQIGLVILSASPSEVLGLTPSQSAITSALATTPATTKGADLPAATWLALNALTKAKVALGAVVVISDGAGATTGRSGITPLSVRQQAASIGAQVETVGISGPASSVASLNRLRSLSPGSYVSATASHLTRSVKSVVNGFTQDYVLRYRSPARAGSKVSVAVSAAAIPGSVSLAYKATGAPHRPPAAAKPVSRPHHPSAPSLVGATQLSPAPAFAPAPPPPAPAPNTGFWASSTAVFVVALAVALLIGVALAVGLYRPSRRAVRVRVGSFVPSAAEHVEESQTSEKRTGLLTSLQRGHWWPPFVEAVEVSRGKYSPIQLVRRAAGIAFLLAVILLVVTGSMLAALAPLILFPFALRFFVNRQAEKQRAKFRDMLPSYLQDLASAIRVGRSFVGALTVVGESADEPTRGEFERAATDEALGRPLEESLEAVSRRMRSNDMDQVALIAALNRKSGANVAESLDRVAEGARDRADLRREIKALTAQAKMSSIILSALPGVLLVGLSVLSPQYAHPLFHTTIGLAVLAVGGVMVAMGWKVMQKITKVEA